MVRGKRTDVFSFASSTASSRLDIVGVILGVKAGRGEKINASPSGGHQWCGPTV